jgi:hypothetical protein
MYLYVYTKMEHVDIFMFMHEYIYIYGGVFDSEELEEKGYVNIYIYTITHM